MKGRVHVLGDALSRAPHASMSVKNTNIDTPTLALPEGIVKNYYDDLTFGEIYRSMQGEVISNIIKAEKIKRILPHFMLNNNVL